MPRRTRKQIVGKIENVEIVRRLRELGVWERLLKREWWSKRRGQVSASEVLPLTCPHARRERERARRDYLAMDVFEHREE